MKFALTKLMFVEVCDWMDTCSDDRARAAIDKMYKHAYGSRAGSSLLGRSDKTDLTPNEERLILALQDRYSNYHSYSTLGPIVVDCGENSYVFVRGHDEYGRTVSVPDDCWLEL